MDINDYFDTVDKKVSEMTDKEFEQLLIDSGLNSCPYEDESICCNCNFLVNGTCKSENICVEGDLNTSIKQN